MRIFTSDQLMDRWQDRREIRNLFGRLSADYILKEERSMYDNYWSRRDDVCLGVNQGYYFGAEAVANYYKACDERVSLESRLLKNAFPEKFQGIPEEKVYGAGMMDWKPMDTEIIEIAGDGQSAKALFSVRGSYSRITKAGPVAYWQWGWYAADCIKENGAWKIWHLLTVDDINHPCGSRFTEAPKKFDEEPDFAEIESFRMPEPNIKASVRSLYAADRSFTCTPRMPEPYDTFKETFSYGYEGVAE